MYNVQKKLKKKHQHIIVHITFFLKITGSDALAH